MCSTSVVEEAGEAEGSGLRASANPGRSNGLAEAERIERQNLDAEARLAEIAGVLHAAEGAMVTLIADAIDGDMWFGFGVHSPVHWLAWKSGMAKRRAKAVVQIAKRRSEIPVAVEALVRGELSLDQVRAIAAHVPAEFDQAATELAHTMTVSQLERVLPRYAWYDADEPPAEAPASSPTDDPTADPAEAPAEPSSDDRQEPLEENRKASWYFDDRARGHLSANLPADEAMIFEAALAAARADLLAQRSAAAQPGEVVPWISEADVLMHLATHFLAHGHQQHPGRERFLIHVHLEQHPDGTPVMRSHLGPVVPDVFRRFLTCDGDVRPVWEVHGKPISVGRTQRLVPERARRLIEQRDGGCVVPGCDRRRGLDVHHIRHWEDGGPTDTSNLCCLCRRHHRQHHLGQIRISGNPDEPAGIIITNQFGRRLTSAPASVAVDPNQPPEQAAAARDLPAPTYRPGSGERVMGRFIDMAPNPGFSVRRAG